MSWDIILVVERSSMLYVLLFIRFIQTVTEVNLVLQKSIRFNAEYIVIHVT